MGLFQKSVLKSYLNQQNKDVVEKAYVRFKKIYDSANIEEIKKLKEEEYQTGFFNDIFINVLGYTLRPTKGFNFKVEQKNVTDSKKADGAILNAKEEIIGVVELKSTATKNLDLAKDQAFNYKHNHSTCKYVIVSNFDKVQFYINDSVNKEEFSLFNMTREDFSLFYLCLAKDNILSDLPLKIKESSISEEKQITAKFYKDYTAFRDELYLNIKKNNLQNSLLKEHAEKGIKLTLFKKTQKLLDRFLFILFAEDTSLLAPNFNQNILNKWKTYNHDGIDLTLYDFYKKQFSFLDTGRAGTTDNEEIFAYNGGLFKPDPILDKIIKIDDDVLYKHSKQLSTYNFDSQVDVNILGHIFENSLNEIENITAEIEGDSVDKQKTKRKKDGIFYTPKYITKYIIDNTIGKLCEEKKIELGIDEEITDKFITKSRKLNKEGSEYNDRLNTYRTWLLGLKICDPACGSGAFLNQALIFLMDEHDYIDSKILMFQNLISGNKKQISTGQRDISNEILENNIFGVDINEESVEIAKLSLWLRTAQPRRKLNDLSNNIKCGNSLIDIKTVAGDKAFKWENEFPHVFANGGFDVVIGNPPYGAKISKSESEFISKKFNNIVSGEIDTYIVFYLETVNILKQNGVLGFITPDTWLTISKAKGLRKYLKNNTLILDIHDWYKPFKDAKDTRCHSIVLRKMQELNYNFNVTVVDSNEIEIKKFSVPIKNLKTLDEWNIYTSPLENLIFNKMKSESKYLDELYNIKYGLRTGENSKYLTNDISESIDGIKIARGSNIERYYFNWKPEYLKNKDGLPSTYLEEKALNREKIIIQYVRTNSTDINSKWLEPTLIEEKNFLPLNSTSFIYSKTDDLSLQYLLAILSSNLMNRYYKANYTDVNVKPLYLSKLPIKLDFDKQPILVNKVNLIIELKKNFNLIPFIKLLQSKFKIIKLSNKLQHWYLLEFSDFLKELKKVNVEMSLPQEAEWLQYFNEQKEQAQALKLEIDETDKEIDNLVYNLYGLTAAEIELVENSIN